jgi:hypothetical protein
MINWFSNEEEEKKEPKDKSKFYGKLDKELQEKVNKLGKLIEERNRQTEKLINFELKELSEDEVGLLQRRPE